MPIKRSSIKDVRRNRRRRERNIVVMSRLRGQVSKVRKAETPEAAAKEALLAEKLLDKAARMGYIKLNPAARKKSRLSQHVNRLSKAA